MILVNPELSIAVEMFDVRVHGDQFDPHFVAELLETTDDLSEGVEL